jgi:hypothetical protein
MAKFKEGDAVRVRSSVKEPEYGWGYMEDHTEVGVVADAPDGSLDLYVDFPSHSHWHALESELVLASETEVLQPEPRLRITHKKNSSRKIVLTAVHTPTYTCCCRAHINHGGADFVGEAWWWQDNASGGFVIRDGCIEAWARTQEANREWDIMFLSSFTDTLGTIEVI